MPIECDVCVVGSGAGGGPVAATLSEAGYRVVVLERGPWFESREFLKDEVAFCRRPTAWPDPREAPQLEEFLDRSGRIAARPTDAYSNGSLVGGSSVLMSGFFLRLKPVDFRLRSTFGPVEGADPQDWPLTYADLEPWYDRAEREVGVSGMVREDLPAHLRDERTSPDLPFPPTFEHPLATHIDRVCEKQGWHSLPLPRAILSEPHAGRRGCEYAGYCGSYGCRTDAKGSSLAAFLPRALATGRCQVLPRSTVTRLESDETGRVRRAHYVDPQDHPQQVEARVFVVACQAIESARLLLNSPGPRHPRGLANRSGMVGRNLLFSTYGACWGDYTRGRSGRPQWFDSTEPFLNRALQDWYVFDQGGAAAKGGTLNFLLAHPNPISAAEMLAFGDPARGGRPLWGEGLKQRLERWFRDQIHLKCEVFGEWLPAPPCRVTVDGAVRDRYGMPAARVNAWGHPRNRETAQRLVAHGLEALRAMGAEDLRTPPAYGGPSTNLVGGTCRMGTDPGRSVLDPQCRAHDVDNLYVSDGSSFPSGGSVPFTFTIYANALRVSEAIVTALGGRR